MLRDLIFIKIVDHKKIILSVKNRKKKKEFNHLLQLKRQSNCMGRKVKKKEFSDFLSLVIRKGRLNLMSMKYCKRSEML